MSGCGRARGSGADEWQIALFGDQNPPDKRDLVEGKLVQLGMRDAERGINVVFDFGFWGKDERSALRWIAGTVGARPRPAQQCAIKVSWPIVYWSRDWFGSGPGSFR
jgi:predicted kinase